MIIIFIALVDDCASERSNLKNALTEAFEDENIKIDTLKEYEDGNVLIQDMSDTRFDFIFLDIYMGTINGIETAEKIRTLDQDVKIIFVTSSNDFASESFSVNASHYVLKPITRDKVREVLERCNLNDVMKNRCIFLPDGQKLLVRSIMYTTYYNHVISIHLCNDTIVKTRLQQSRMESLLSDFSFFISCSKGTIVNFNFVKDIEEEYFIMENEEVISISRRRKKDVREAFKNFLFSQLKES